MRNDDLKRLIKSQEPTFLKTARHKGYVCPECGNGSGRDGDGITRKPGSDFFHCFKCGLHDDVFGLIGSYYGLDSFEDQKAKAIELYGIASGEITLPKSPATSYKEEKPEPEVDHTDEYKVWNEALNVPGNPGLAYMQARGLSLETLNRFGIGYASKWKHPKTKKLEKVPFSPRVIIPTSPTSYLARDIRDDAKLKDSEKRYTKSKVSRVRIFNVEALKDAKETVFIVEGEIDAMSIHEVGGLAVGLGSASNTDLFVEAIKESPSNVDMVILPDNDEAGKSSAAKLEKVLKDAGVKVSTANIFGSYKDANKMLVEDRDKLKALIDDLKPLAPAKQQAPKSNTDITNRALLSLLNLHDRHREYLKGMGLTDEQIDKNCYRSAPSSPKEICKQMKRMGCTFENNPLFFIDIDKEWTIKSPSSGIFIPERNSRGQIQGFERISDMKDGTSIPLSHAHFRRGARGISEAVVTNSALRADIICALSGYSVIAVPENVTEKSLNGVLGTLKERGLENVRIAWNKSLEKKAYADTLKLAFKMQNISCKTIPQDKQFGGLEKYLLAMKKKQEGGQK